MFVIIIFGLVAACSAAPLNEISTQPPNTILPQISILEYRLIHKHFASAENYQQFLKMVAQYYNMFPPGEATQGVQGDEYKITIPVFGLEKKDVVITGLNLKAALLVQAVDKQSNDKMNYIALRPLPACVNGVVGKYKIENGVLEISLPLIPGKVCEEVAKVPTIVAAGATTDAINVEPAYLAIDDVNGHTKFVPVLFSQKLIELLNIRVLKNQSNPLASS